MTSSRAAIVMAALPPAIAGLEHAAAIVEGWLAGVEARWPGTRIDLARLAAWLPDRVTSGLEALCGEDVALVCAASSGDSVAIKAIDAILGGEVERVLPARRDRDGHDELHQAVRAKLFAGTGKLDEYRGVGSLRRWLRMVALRTHLDAERATGRRVTVAVSDEELATAAGVDDPALAYLKQHYRAEVRIAVADAIATLPPHGRVLLRQHYLSRLTLDQLAAIYEVHPVTISRWVATARDELSAAVRAALGRRLGLPASELDSVLELVQTNLELSLQRLLDD